MPPRPDTVTLEIGRTGRIIAQPDEARGWASLRILLIEDEPKVAGLLADAVAADGHETLLAYSGLEGLASLELRPDAVFLDVRLPEMSGIEVLRQIRISHPELPVVLITGHAEESELEEARSLGVAGVVQKPSILRNLTEVLKRLK